ncbi:tetratricopeptide repeat protein [Winogradskyella immobilis]|uniref:Tetratricopeptide repeat protein n=1 Tax=Winogradskyella immobilis TaxID=2816852 RepID=A0ABS8EJ94_9FLAO|nr:tetratricopeptide repeat protein [Winogradskyella immobilis]MCC1483269.1 tetratricopeptide repeat protein [Winogradskyella immobilis]MCG0015363.1 tetratricopeptide repeat protein [Winogradskyella immobilis]
MKAFVVYIFVIGFGLSVFAQNNTLFEQGNTLYNDGKYAEAIEKYEAILNTKNHSAELYYNLANAHYKLNNVAPSIFYFEKALHLNPEDEEIKNNIAFARNMTVDAIDTIPEVGFSRFIKNAINWMSFDNWSKLAVVCIFIFVIVFLSYYFSYTSNRKRLAFIVSILSLIIAILSVTMAFQKYNLEASDNPAIVFSQESIVKTEPNLRSEEAFRLHEGTKVQVLEQVKLWSKIKIADGTTGWISSEEIKLFNDF